MREGCDWVMARAIAAVAKAGLEAVLAYVGLVNLLQQEKATCRAAICSDEHVFVDSRRAKFSE